MIRNSIFTILAGIAASLGATEPPEINGPFVFGVRPGSPVLYSIPATGRRPIVFAAEGLPAGLSLAEETGRISGSVTRRGEYLIRLKATNADGVAARDLQLKVGESIALTPPMGWNSWNCWGDKVDQAKILRAARAMVATGLASHGWTYINIDDGWQGKRDGDQRALQGNAKFPDLAGLCAAIHALGLKTGIYSAPWVTSYAGYPGGSSDREDGAWSPSMAGIENRRLGAHSFAAVDARQWAAWGIDYLKYDWRPIDVPHVAEMSDALRTSGRDIVFSLSNTASIEHAADWARLANSWRTTGDVREHWSLPQEPRKFGISESGFSQDRWAAFAGPGHWNDPDMLVVGEVGLGDPRPTDVTLDEACSQITLWSLLAAPLLIGCDLERLDRGTLELLSNDEVIAVDQDSLGQQGMRLATSGPVDVYVKPLADGGLAVGFFNRDSSAQALDYAKLESLGLMSAQRIRDLWQRRDLPEIEAPASQTLHVSLRPHGARLFKFSPRAGSSEVIVLPLATPGGAHLLAYTALEQEWSHRFQFRVANRSGHAIAITSFRTSCHCTTVVAPASPWEIQAGEEAIIPVVLDFSGEHGAVVRTADLETTAGPLHLVIEADLPSRPARHGAGLHGAPETGP